MTMKKVLLGTSALLGAGFVALSSPVQAADVTPGGVLDLTLQGYIRFKVAGGDLRNFFGNQDIKQFDFAQDGRIELIARGKSESTGTEYGAYFRFNVDGGDSVGVDRAYVFFRGGWGEVRGGDLNGPVDNMKVGAYTIAAGTGGIDGDDPVAFGLAVIQTNSGDATKAVYYSPTVAGFQLGVSYTPGTGDGGNGDSFQLVENTGYEDFIEGGVTWTGAFGGVDILAGVTGSTADNAVAGGTLTTIQGGATVSAFGFKFGGGIGTQDDNDNGRTFYNLGVGATFGPVDTSITWGQASLDAAQGGGNPYDLVLSADIGLMPGVTLAGDVAFFDFDSGTNDDGVTGLARIEVAF